MNTKHQPNPSKIATFGYFPERDIMVPDFICQLMWHNSLENHHQFSSNLELQPYYVCMTVQVHDMVYSMYYVYMVTKSEKKNIIHILPSKP